jgi:hypothetical protein
VTTIPFRTLDLDLSPRTRWGSQSRSFGCGFVLLRVRLAVAFHLPTQVFKPMALAPALVEGSLMGSSLGDRAKAGTA